MMQIVDSTMAHPLSQVIANEGLGYVIASFACTRPEYASSHYADYERVD